MDSVPLYSPIEYNIQKSTIIVDGSHEMHFTLAELLKANFVPQKLLTFIIPFEQAKVSVSSEPCDNSPSKLKLFLKIFTSANTIQ